MDTHRQGLEEGKRCWVEQEIFLPSIFYDKLEDKMTTYIEDMYNNPNVEVVSMNTIYEQDKADGIYRVIFVLRKPQPEDTTPFQAKPTTSYKWSNDDGWKEAGAMERAAVEEWLGVGEEQDV